MFCNYVKNFRRVLAGVDPLVGLHPMLIPFLVRAHVWVVSSVPGRMNAGDSEYLSLSLSLSSLFLTL